MGSLGLLRSAMGDVAALDQLIFKKTEGNKRGIPEAFGLLLKEVFEHLWAVGVSLNRGVTTPKHNQNDHFLVGKPIVVGSHHF